jgi:predicted NBD/HSP70 family sugar kinase
VLGIDLGATNLRVALGTPEGEIVARAAEPVPPTPAALAARVAALARGLGNPVAAAAGVPGIVDGDAFAGTIAGAAALGGAPLRQLLTEALGVPVALDNDVNLAALAEQHARGVDDLAFIAVGTGIGMGIVSGGRLLRGAHGGAGEIGHLPVAARDAVAGADGLGPLEALAGGAGIEALHPGPAHAAYADGAADALAAAIRAVHVTLDPALIVLGGGIGSRPEVLELVRAALLAPAPRVEASLLGADAGLVGALLLADAG